MMESHSDPVSSNAETKPKPSEDIEQMYSLPQHRLCTPKQVELEMYEDSKNIRLLKLRKRATDDALRGHLQMVDFKTYRESFMAS